MMDQGSSSQPTEPANDGARLEDEGSSRFDIYRTEQVQLTATRLGGGDWHWRLVDAAGGNLAHGGGYRDQRDCMAAVDALREVASSATVSKRPGLRLVGGQPE